MLQTLLVILSIFSVALIIYVIKNKNIWDSLLGMGLFSKLIVLGTVLYATVLDNTMFLDTAIAFTLLGFVGTIFSAIFIYKKGGM